VRLKTVTLSNAGIGRNESPILRGLAESQSIRAEEVNQMGVYKTVHGGGQMGDKPCWARKIKKA